MLLLLKKMKVIMIGLSSGGKNALKNNKGVKAMIIAYIHML